MLIYSDTLQRLLIPFSEDLSKFMRCIGFSSSWIAPRDFQSVCRNSRLQIYANMQTLHRIPFQVQDPLLGRGTHSSIPRRHTAGSFMYQSQVNRFKVFCASWSRRYLCAALPLSASAYHTFSRLGASFWNLELLLHMHDIAFNSVQQAHNYLY